MVKLGFCGDDCNACPRYIATLSGDIEKLKDVAIMWKRGGWRDTIVSPDEIKCNGCATVERCVYDDIRKCGQKKNIENCGECRDYPCEKIEGVFEKTRQRAIICKENCSKEDYECFHQAFFSKKEKLDKINEKYFR